MFDLGSSIAPVAMHHGMLCALEIPLFGSVVGYFLNYMNLCSL